MREHQAALPGRDRQPRILIVDDAHSSQEILESMLLPEGYVVAAVASGEEALAIVQTSPPDLVLLDLVMGGMGGYELTERMKAAAVTRNIPIIIITALEARAARMRALDAGAEDVLTKPVDRAELCLRVRNLLRLKGYADYVDHFAGRLESEVRERTSDLRRERDRAQLCMDSAEVILLALDENARVTQISRYACSLLGWTAEELHGQDFIELCIPAQARPAVRTTLDAALKGNQTPVSHPVLTRSGEERFIEWRNTLVRDDEGNVIGTFSSGTDITERTNALEALRAAEERTRFALSVANIGIWDMDHVSGTLTWSETIEAHYGFAPGTFPGTFEAFINAVHPDDREAVVDTIQRAASTGSEFSVHHRSLAFDGRVRWLSGYGRILLDESGKPTRSLGISQDATEQRTLRRQFEQAQKMEAIGQLASGVAHDFNNLLTVILGFGEILAADRDLGRQHKRDLDEIMQAGRRAAGLTGQLLAFSRKQVLQTVPVDVNALIRGMVGMLRRLIGEHVEIKLALGPDLQPALADRGQLEQVVMNLVVNARDAMPDGGRITIRTAAADLENSAFHEETVVSGQYVVLSVTDNGVGMTEETRRHLFEPFFTTKNPGDGTGLGLSTIYGIVKQSNGYIWVYSEPGNGAAFNVYLPRAGSAVVPHAPRLPAATPVARATERILLVEDEAGVRDFSKRILERAGYSVIEAPDGIVAERLFDQYSDSIALVVSDVVMPNCGGPELVERLIGRAPGLRVIFMSGYTEQAAVHKRMFERHLLLQKPFTGAELTRYVRNALDAPAAVAPGVS